MLKKLLYKIEYKKIKEEFNQLENFFESQFERYAAVGNDDNEDESKRNEKLTERFNYLCARCEKLENILNKNN